MDILVDILNVIWKVFAGVVIAIATITLVGTVAIKFIEFWVDKEGDDYKKR